MYYKRTQALMTSESHKLSEREDSSNYGQTHLVKVWSSWGMNPKQMSHEHIERNVLTTGSCGVTKGRVFHRSLIFCERMLLSQWSTCGMHSLCAVKMCGKPWHTAISLWKESYINMAMKEFSNAWEPFENSVLRLEERHFFQLTVTFWKGLHCLFWML